MFFSVKNPMIWWKLVGVIDSAVNYATVFDSWIYSPFLIIEFYAKNFPFNKVHVK